MIGREDLDYSKVRDSILRKVPSLAPLLDTADAAGLEKILVALRRHAFFVSNLEKISQIRFIQRELARAIEDGTGFKGFKERVRAQRPEIKKRLDALSKSRLETVYRTNAAQAYEDGAIEGAIETGAFLQYSAVGDSRTRPSHQELDGIELPADDPRWSSLRPPLDFNCRCSLIAVPKRRANRTNKRTVDKKLDSFKKAGGAPSGFGKNTTQDAKSIRRYLERRADGANISKKEIKELEERETLGFTRFAKRILNEIGG